MNSVLISSADEWAIHKRATDVVFAQEANLGITVHYNNVLNNHERVREYAESIGAEIAVARYFGLDYILEESRGKRMADVGQGLEVRWTSHRMGGLFAYTNDRDSDVGVLVTGKSPEYQVIGWLPISFARVKKYKMAGADSWWVPQSSLNPMENLARSDYASAI